VASADGATRMHREATHSVSVVSSHTGSLTALHDCLHSATNSGDGGGRVVAEPTVVVIGATELDEEDAASVDEGGASRPHSPLLQSSTVNPWHMATHELTYVSFVCCAHTGACTGGHMHAAVVGSGTGVEDDDPTSRSPVKGSSGTGVGSTVVVPSPLRFRITNVSSGGGFVYVCGAGQWCSARASSQRGAPAAQTRVSANVLDVYVNVFVKRSTAPARTIVSQRVSWSNALVVNTACCARGQPTPACVRARGDKGETKWGALLTGFGSS
jgi:hypothetical protein